MSDSRGPWSNNPNAPKTPYLPYSYERTWFAGVLIAPIFYGVIVMTFFQCIAALFNPVYRRGEPIKWGLVSYTVVMFSLVSAGTAMRLSVQSSSYIDNREFPGTESGLLPGPIGYQGLIVPDAINLAQNIIFALNNWLADGLLLYRCYVIYSMNPWAIAFPCLMYLGSLAMGIFFVYRGAGSVPILIMSPTFPYFSISLSLNVLLTLMIIIRLVIHARDTRTLMGRTGIGGLYKTIITMFAESCGLYALNSLLYIGLLSAGKSIANPFPPILGQTQVIAPLLIILRAANKSALTSETLASVHISEPKTGTRQELTGGVPPGEDPVNPAGQRGSNSDGLRVSVHISYSGYRFPSG